MTICGVRETCERGRRRRQRHIAGFVIVLLTQRRDTDVRTLYPTRDDLKDIRMSGPSIPMKMI